MNPRLAICVVVDGLRASALGAYGNTIYPTPILDRFAATSTVVERAISTSPSVESFYNNLWMGAGGGPSAAAAELGLLETLVRQGVRTTVFTDDPSVARLAESSAASQVVCIEGSSEGLGVTVDQTDLARLLFSAAEFVASVNQSETAQSTPPSMVWVHSRSLTVRWDAPLNLRKSLMEDEGAQPYSGTVPPTGLSPDDDLDTLLAYREAYAAQVAVFDECFGALLAAAQNTEAGSNALMALVAPRGISLGEHDSGPSDVHNESVHVPCVVGPCTSRQPGTRLRGLHTPVVLLNLLNDWFVESSPGQLGWAGNEEKQLVSLAPSWRAARTMEWTLIERLTDPQSKTPEEPVVQLYAFPDDRWELNNVAERCPEVVAGLQKPATASTGKGCS